MSAILTTACFIERRRNGLKQVLNRNGPVSRAISVWQIISEAFVNSSLPKSISSKQIQTKRALDERQPFIRVRLKHYQQQPLQKLQTE
jgi:hypothetical protein